MNKDIRTTSLSSVSLVDFEQVNVLLGHHKKFTQWLLVYFKNVMQQMLFTLILYLLAQCFDQLTFI